MTSNKLLKILLLFILLPFTTFIVASGVFLFINMKQSTLSAIDNANHIYQIALVNDARYALSTGNAITFQQNIDHLVNESAGQLLSIELVNNSRTIIASSPADPDLTAPAIRVPVIVSINNDELMDYSVSTPHEEEAGYIEIRYNNKLPDNAINRFLSLFGLLFVVLTSVIAITAFGLRRKVFTPINRVTKRIENLIDGTFIEEMQSNDFLSPIDHGLNILARKQAYITEQNQNMKEQVRVSKSKVDTANVTKVILISELIEKMDKHLLNSREILFSVISSNKDDRIRDGLKIIASHLGDFNKTISDSRILMEQVGHDSVNEPVSIQDFYDGLSEFTRKDNIEVIPALLCFDKYKQHVVRIDTLNIYQLIGNIFTLATFTGRDKPEIYITVRAEFQNEHSFTITIDVKDSSQGLPAETVRGFNQFMNNENISFRIPGFPVNDLQIIRYLCSRGSVMVGMTSEYGRGNNFRVTIDREDIPANHLNNPTIPRSSGAILHNGATNTQLPGHFHTLGIDLQHILQYNAPAQIADIIKMDFVIVEFTDDINETLELCEALLSRNPDLYIIPAYHDQQISKTGLQDKLFDLHIRGRHLAMPYGSQSILNALRGDAEPHDVIAKLLESFTKK